MRFEPPLDNPMVQFGVVGFLHTNVPEQWGRNQLEFLEASLAGDLDPVKMEQTFGEGEALTAFCCFAVGAMLGMHAADRLPDPVFRAWQLGLFAFAQAYTDEIAEIYRSRPATKPPGNPAD